VRDIRYVVVHTPGARWRHGLPIFEQEGIQDHIAHFREWLAQGKLAIGGPFLDEYAGGMMVPTEGLSEAAVTAFANADPAVRSGLLKVAVRQWLVGMKQ
jgi:uncharacterized protein YciI